MGERVDADDASGLVPGRATICIVNYKTLDVTRWCLRALRKRTHYPHEVVVVDNDSGDASLDYLRSLDWIRLIEHRPKDARGNRAHGSGLQAGFEACQSEFFVAMHSDTIVRRDGWLEMLVSHAEDPGVASVGAGKLELQPAWYTWLKRSTRVVRRRLAGRPVPPPPRPYNRTICSLYRTAILRAEGLSFLYDEARDLNPGKGLHFDLEERGHRTVTLPDAELARYVHHLAHATQAANPEFQLRRRTRNKHERRLARVVASAEMRGVIDDASLDA